MSAPQIPNLNTFRRGGGRTKLRGRAGPSGGPSTRPFKDTVVQETDNDASGSRLSAVELGYLEDPFISLLFPNGVQTRRFPIINRGTYVRTMAIDVLVDRFLNSGAPGKKQIISLGSGSDTRIFRLLSKNPGLDIIYHELDFTANTSPKIRSILAIPLLHRILGISNPSEVDVSPEQDAFHSSKLHIHSIDLRILTASSPATLLRDVDPTLPTLMISECCLIYLRPEEASNVISYFAQTALPHAALSLVLYEPINPHDPFGRTMVSNLAMRGIVLQTLHQYDTLTAEKTRLQEHGFNSGQEAADVDFLWEQWVSEVEKERVARLEMLDELEEWRLLARHYCVAWGWREAPGAKTKAFSTWETLQAQVNQGGR